MRVVEVEGVSEGGVEKRGDVRWVARAASEDGAGGAGGGRCE